MRETPILTEEISKTYCCECNLLFEETGHSCICPANIKEKIEMDTWYGPVVRYITLEHPKVINKNNLCAWFEPKKTKSTCACKH